MSVPFPTMPSWESSHRNGFEFDPGLFELSPNGLSKSARNEAFSALADMVTIQRNHFFGY